MSQPPDDAPPPSPDAIVSGSAPATGVGGPLLAAAITTAIVTAASYLAPDRYAATLVGVGFLGSAWWLVLRHDEATVRAYGLSLGGVLEPAPLDLRRLAHDALVASGWALLLMVVVFPPFALGYRAFWSPHGHFALRLPHTLAGAIALTTELANEIAGQLVVIALPEEVFFRGYLQTSLDRVWLPRWRVLGADLGPGWLVAAAIFAIGHVLTIPHAARLAVFFPALAFGWLCRRSGGVGASVLFHAACNLFAVMLGRGFGLL